MKADIVLNRNPHNASIVVDGKPITSCVGALRVQRTDGALEIIASADTFPRLHLELLLEEMDISIEGDLIVNAIPVSDAVGKAIYESLKERYEKEI